MGFKVVNAFALPGADFGDELLDSLDATLAKGMWRTEEEIIAHAQGADSNRRPMTQVVEALRGELPVYTVNTDVRTKWMTKWGKKESRGAI